MKNNKTVVIYPGSFDPITNGHLDVLERIIGTYDKVICAIGENSDKNYLFSLDNRLDMMHHTVPKNVRVNSFKGLLIDYAKTVKRETRPDKVLIARGIRMNSDFEEELKMTLNNRKLCPWLDYRYLPPSQGLIHVNSRFIKDIAKMNPKRINQLDVPKYVKQKLKEKYG